MEMARRGSRQGGRSRVRRSRKRHGGRRRRGTGRSARMFASMFPYGGGTLAINVIIDCDL